MIRPVTVICMLLAAGSGLYLYQTKHQAQMLDRDIVRTLKSVDADRQRTGLLKAQYAMLNDPEHLGALAGQLLPGLKTTAPGQFTTLAELDKRLPPVGLPAAPVELPLEAAPPVLAMTDPVAEPRAAERSETADAARGAGAQLPTAASRPAATPPVAAAAPPPHRPAPPVLAAATPAAPAAALVPVPVPRPAPPPRLAMTPAAPRPTLAATTGASPFGEELPGIARPAPILARAPMVGSALGMARSMGQPASYAGPPPSGDGQR